MSVNGLFYVAPVLILPWTQTQIFSSTNIRTAVSSAFGGYSTLPSGMSPPRVCVSPASAGCHCSPGVCPVSCPPPHQHSSVAVCRPPRSSAAVGRPPPLSMAIIRQLVLAAPRLLLSAVCRHSAAVCHRHGRSSPVSRPDGSGDGLFRGHPPSRPSRPDERRCRPIVTAALGALSPLAGASSNAALLIGCKPAINRPTKESRYQ